MHDADVPVTRIEFALFEQLCRRPAEVCSRTELLEEVWGPNWVGDTHVVDVHLSNLRRKLQQRAPELRFIHTVRGVGFRLSNDLLRSIDEPIVTSQAGSPQSTAVVTDAPGHNDETETDRELISA